MFWLRVSASCSRKVLYHHTSKGTVSEGFPTLRNRHDNPTRKFDNSVPNFTLKSSVADPDDCCPDPDPTFLGQDPDPIAPTKFVQTFKRTLKTLFTRRKVNRLAFLGFHNTFQRKKAKKCQF
jgi:hypothetical protein